MKLYTEEQVRRAMGAGMHIGYSNQFNIDNITNEVDKAIKYLTPIELPSDRDIEIAANGNQEHYEGAMWLKHKYLTKTNNL